MPFDPSTATLAPDSAPAATAFDPSTATLAPDSPATTAAGLGGSVVRGLASGVAGVASLVNQAGSVIGLPSLADSAPAPADTTPEPYKPQLSDFVHPDKWQQAAEYFADKAGVPAAQTPTERVVQSAAAALPYVVLGPEGFEIPAARTALGVAAGGGAQQTVAELGGGPVAQTIAGLVTPLAGAGAAGAVRTATRGAGEAKAADMVRRIAAAADRENPIPLTVGQASNNSGLRGAEQLSSAVLGGGPLAAVADKQAAGIEGRVNGIVDDLSPGGTPTPTTAGQVIQTGAKLRGAFMGTEEQQAYDNLDRLVPSQTPINVQSTLRKLDALATPAQGAEATTGALVPPKIAQMRENLTTDVANNGGTVPYSAVRQLRTAVGNQISALSSDPTANGAFKQIYGALSDDMNAGVAGVSSEARQAAMEASSLYKANQATRDNLDQIINKNGGPEAVYAAAMQGAKGGATRINQVMGALMNPASKNLFRATVLDNLGTAADGSFDSGTFLRKWGQLSDESKDALFGSAGGASPESIEHQFDPYAASGQLRAALDSVTDTIGTLKKQGALLTTTQREKQFGGVVNGSDILAKLITEGGAALAGHAAGGLLGLGAGTVGLPLANYGFARLMTNPKFMGWLARTTKLPPGAIPNAINQLQKMGQAQNDPGMQGFAARLQQSQPQAGQ